MRKPFIFKQNILQENVQLDGSINFQTNGDINIFPCPWESDKEVTDGERVRYRAGIEVDADGRTRVKRYNDGKNGPKLETLYETAHGAVKMTRPLYRKNDSGRSKAGQRFLDKEFVYVTFKFSKKYPLELIRQLFDEEGLEIAAWLMTRKTNTLWNND